MPSKRKKDSRGASLMPVLSFNDGANSFKVSETGFDVVTILGSLATAVECGKNKPVIIANNAAAAAFIKFGTSAVAAPTGLSDGLFLPPNSLTVWSSGQNTHVRASAATVGGYVANEDAITDAADQAAVV